MLISSVEKRHLSTAEEPLREEDLHEVERKKTAGQGLRHPVYAGTLTEMIRLEPDGSDGSSIEETNDGCR